jgi:hypothetical protein
VLDVAIEHVEGQPGSWFGQEVAAAMDGGTDWLSVGAPRAPAVYDEGEAWSLELPSLATGVVWTAKQAYDVAGSAMAHIEPTGEAAPWLAVGALNRSTPTAPLSGAVYVVARFPEAGENLDDDADLIIEHSGAEFIYARLGSDVAWMAGADPAVRDLVVTAPQNPPMPSATDFPQGSAVYAFPGDLRGHHEESAASRVLRADEWGLGNVASWDEDADGVDDLAVTYAGPGQVLSFAGPWDSDLVPAYASSVWASEPGLYPSLFTDLGDVTGDGYPELAVGSSVWSGAAERGGAVWLIEGGGVSPAGNLMDTPLLWEGAEVGAGVGGGGGGGDLSGDGQRDLVLAAYGVVPSEAPGYVLVFEGPVLSARLEVADAWSILYGESVGDAFGIDLAVLDADADGRDDLAVGASGWNQATGRVYLILGPDLAPL